MKKIPINQTNPEDPCVNLAASVLKKGGIIVYPTDTSYGIGANALDENAINKIYKIKDRSFDKPTHVVVRDWKMIESLCEVNDSAKKLHDKFLPGPLTIILKKKSGVSNILTARLPTLGVRLPDSKVTTKISALVSFPYTTPSVNYSGGKEPYSIDEVLNQLDSKKIDLILDAGILKRKKPSTIVNLSKDTPRILRHGPIPISEVEKILRTKLSC